LSLNIECDGHVRVFKPLLFTISLWGFWSALLC